MSYNPPPFPEPASPPRTWTLATYNVQDLFDTTGDPTASDERPTENQLRNKMTRLSRVLHILNADIVGLMEVETLGVLQHLNQEYLGDLEYREAILIEGNDPERGIDVALLSRFPVNRIVSHAGEIFQDATGDQHRIFSRDCLECHVELSDGQTVVVLVNHFKSKRGDDQAASDGLRRMQAETVRQIVGQLAPMYPLLAVVGDLNDTPDSAPLAPLLRDGLADLLPDVPDGWRDTFVHAGQPERIDYLLATPELAERLVPGSVFIPRDAFAARASDHLPARATFRLDGSAVTPYVPNVTVAYLQTRPAVRRGHRAFRINAGRFSPYDLHRMEGQTVVLTGVVRRADVTAGTGTVRLFLGNGDPDRAFRVVVFPDRLPEFARAGIGDLAGYYRGKTVQGVGPLRFHRGRPEIAAETPGQLKIVRGDTADGLGV